MNNTNIDKLTTEEELWRKAIYRFEELGEGIWEVSRNLKIPEYKLRDMMKENRYTKPKTSLLKKYRKIVEWIKEGLSNDDILEKYKEVGYDKRICVSFHTISRIRTEYNKSKK